MRTLHDVVTLPGTPYVAGDLAFGITLGEVGPFEGSFAGGKEKLSIYRADALAAVVGCDYGVNRPASEHGCISKIYPDISKCMRWAASCLTVRRMVDILAFAGGSANLCV
jgi:hypothetical protein